MLCKARWGSGAYGGAGNWEARFLSTLRGGLPWGSLARIEAESVVTQQARLSLVYF